MSNLNYNNGGGREREREKGGEGGGGAGEEGRETADWCKDFLKKIPSVKTTDEKCFS